MIIVDNLIFIYRRFNDIVLNRDDKLRNYYLKSAQKEKFNPTDVDSDSS